MIEPIRYDRETDKLLLIDQRKLPLKHEVLELTNYKDVARAIENMVVRGAPAIGITASYGLVLSVANPGSKDRKENFRAARERLGETRPTAVNLFWALDRMKETFRRSKGKGLKGSLLEEAERIKQEDIRANREMGKNGAQLLKDEPQILTHCNAGGLATGGYGTALGVIRGALEAGLEPFVWVDETRPRLQGAKLTAWELKQVGIPFKIIVEGAAPSLMARGKVDAVVTGADRIAANGDTANKIGTYGLALDAEAHGVPFYVAAPLSTIDLDLEKGQGIPIEERKEAEVLELEGTRLAPEGAKAYNPAFDVTPANLIDHIITERKVLSPPFEEEIASAFD